MQFVNKNILQKLISGEKNSMKKKRIKTFVLLEKDQLAPLFIHSLLNL